MPSWKKAFEVEEIKRLIEEGRGEVLDEVVQDYVKKNLAKKK